MSQAKVKLFTSPTCPHCPHAKKVMVQVASSREDVLTEELSTATPKGQKQARTLQVRSVPTMFITGPGTDERIGYVGVPSAKQLSRMIDIALGKAEWPEREGLITKIMNKLR